jgi:hypothetical protein
LDPTIVTDWQQRILTDTSVNRLPNARGAVTVAAGVATITVTWRATTLAAGVANENRYVTQVSL